MVQTQIDQLVKVQNDLLVNAAKEKHAYEIRTRSGAATQDTLYPEGHPKRIEQDSQQAENSGSTRKKRKKKHKTVVEPSERAIDPNSISISDAETESGNEENEVPNEEKLKKNLKTTLRILNTPKKILLLRNMVVKENLGSKNLCLSLIRNTSQRKMNTTISFVSG